MRRPRLSRIGVKLVLAVAAILVVQVAVRSWVEFASDARNFRESFLKAGRAHALSVAQGAEYGLLASDKRELERVADGRRTPADTDLLYVAFYDEAGRLLTARNWSGTPGIIPEKTNPRAEPGVARDAAGEEVFYRFTAPVRLSRKVIHEEMRAAASPTSAGEHGLVVTARSYEPVKERIAEAQEKMLLVSGLALIGAVLVVLFIGHRLVGPIRRLAEGTERIAEGDLATAVDVGRRRDELGDLADSFNRMAGQLRAQRDQIVAYSRDLEQKVAERTADLSNANEGLEREVAERKRAEDNLQKFKDALENSTDAIGISTPHGVHYYQNETFTRMFGDIGNDPSTTIYVDHKVGREVFDTITGGEKWSGEVEMYGKDGNVLSILLRAYPVKKEGRMIAVVGVHTDITARKQAEEALRERIKELKGLNGLTQLAARAEGDVDAYLSKAVGLLPPAWQHSDVACARICLDGRRFETDPGRDCPWRQRAEIRVRGEVRGHVEVGYTEERPEADEGPFLQEERTLITTMAWQLGAIIDRMESQQALAEKADELARSNAELQEFAYVASHDLQEPLRMVASYVQLLEKRYADALDDDAREFIGYAVDGAKRMQALINDLLQYSRVGTKGKPFAPTDCEAVLEEVLSNLEVAVTESGARITHDPLPTVLADEGQLARVFQNLIGNALKFCEGAPEIHVSAERRDGQWQFSVRDNGIGIDPEQHEKVFVVFQRLHGRRDYAGTGMGLAITKKIVERHGGGIRVESEPGEGATFIFTIPDRKESSDGHEHGAGNDEHLAVAGPAGRDSAG